MLIFMVDGAGPSNVARGSPARTAGTICGPVPLSIVAAAAVLASANAGAMSRLAATTTTARRGRNQTDNLVELSKSAFLCMRYASCAAQGNLLALLNRA
jgi:hypothetical protein